MRLSRKTIDVIKTFATINNNLLIEPGSRLRTITVPKNIIGVAEVDEVFEREFGIYNTNEFLGALSLFKEPDVEFGEKAVVIRDGTNQSISLKYVAASKDILVYPEKEVKAPTFDVEFDISQEQLQSLIKGANIIGAPDIQVIGSEAGLSLKVCDRKNPSSNDFQVQVSDQSQVSDFVYNFKVENLRLYMGDHKVKISAKGISLWENTADKVKVYVALENS